MTAEDERRGPRVRFAPSPTGYLHIGGARTALFNWLYARGRGGTFVLRLEDTDAARNTPEARRAIFEGLGWMGIDPDEGPEQGGPYGPYCQSERGSIYREHIERLRESEAIYPCFCPKERLAALREEQKRSNLPWHYDRRCLSIPRDEALARIEAGEPHVWRLRIPPGETSYEDGILGTTTVSNETLDDLILVRADGTPVYNFAVVIDDHTMRITQVIRGQDHRTNTIKQLLIYRALGWEPPRFAHEPLILAPPPHKGKLSKRHGGAELHAYIEKGYPPEAFLNWLALMGWSYDDRTQIMTIGELIERFGLERVGKTPAQLDPRKLDWIAGDWIRRQPEERVEREIRPFLERAGGLERIRSPAAYRLLVRAAHVRIRYWADVLDLFAWAFADRLSYDEKAAAMLRKRPGTRERLARYRASLPPGEFEDPAPLEAHARAFAADEGCRFGELVHPIRAAITGRTESPSLYDCFVILGRDAVVRRLQEAEAFLAREGR